MSDYHSFERSVSRASEIEGLGTALSESYNATSEDIFGELLAQLDTVPETLSDAKVF